MKKIFCFLLSVLLIFSVTVIPSSAEEQITQDNENPPTINEISDDKNEVFLLFFRLQSAQQLF